MTKEKYLNDRKALLDQAQALIDEGKMEEFEAKKKEVEDLDAKFENEAKAAANLRALADKAVVTDLSAASVSVSGKVVETTADTAEDIYNSVEYRKAFMNHVIKGEALPAKFVNSDANTKTTDIPAVIPTTVMERIVEKMESTGMILPLVTRTAYKGGVKIPTSTVKPVASWVAEGAGSDKQKKTTGSIDFAYNKLRCAISVSLETDTMALSVFETTFINNVTEAMTKALEQSIVSGTGSGQPKGFLTETAPTGQALSMAAADKLSYQTLVDAEAALPLAYENGAVWFMTKKTFMAFVGMVDSNKQPIARVNTGINGRPERTLLGRTVVLNDYMVSYADSMAAAGIIAALFNPKDYVLNTNLAMTIKRYEDNDTDDQVTKAVMLVDGKVVDVNSLVTITKAKAGT
jgi:HK97 family phage major capsid protein